MLAVRLALAIPYVVAIALLLADAFGWLRDVAPRSPARRCWPWIAAIVVTYALQLVIVRYGATHAVPYEPWRAGMPLPTVFLYSVNSDWIEIALLACGALQSYAMLVLYRSKPATVAVVLAMAALIVMSLIEPALTSADLYSNVGYALLGAQSYAPPVTPFSGEFSTISNWWGTPLVPAPYGPLWLAIDRAVTAFPATLLGKMMALRIFCCACFVALPLLIRELGLPRRLIVATALNPVLAMQFVVDAHNDVLALAIVLCAAIAFRRRAIAIGAILLVVTGLLKLPYVVLALPVLAVLPSRRDRLAVAGAAVVATLAASWWLGGAQYVVSMMTHVTQQGPVRPDFVWHTVALAVGFVLIAAALLGLRRLRTAVWLLPSIGGFFPTFVYPWYLLWGLPYALARHRVTAYLLIWLPFVAALVDQLAIQLWTILFVFPAILFLSLRLDRHRPTASE